MEKNAEHGKILIPLRTTGQHKKRKVYALHIFHIHGQVHVGSP